MPLTEKVIFKTKLQKSNRVQVPRLIRWQFKLEPCQVLKVGVKPINTWTSGQSFYAKMGKDGRVLIPKLLMTILIGEPSPEDQVMEVSLEPAQE